MHSAAFLCLLLSVGFNVSGAAQVTFLVEGQPTNQSISLCGSCLDTKDAVECSKVQSNKLIACSVTRNISCVYGWWWETITPKGTSIKDLAKDDFRLLDTREITANFTVYSKFTQYMFEAEIPQLRRTIFNLTNYRSPNGSVAVCGTCAAPKKNKPSYSVWGNNCAKWNRVTVRNKMAQVQLLLPSGCSSLEWRWAAVNRNRNVLKYESLVTTLNRTTDTTKCTLKALSVQVRWEFLNNGTSEKCLDAGIRQQDTNLICASETIPKQHELANVTYLSTGSFAALSSNIPPKTIYTRVSSSTQGTTTKGLRDPITNTATNRRYSTVAASTLNSTRISSTVPAIINKHSSERFPRLTVRETSATSLPQSSSNKYHGNDSDAMISTPGKMDAVIQNATDFQDIQGTHHHNTSQTQSELPPAHIGLIAAVSVIAVAVAVAAILWVHKRKRHPERQSKPSAHNPAELKETCSKRRVYQNMDARPDTVAHVYETYNPDARTILAHHAAVMNDIADTVNDLYEVSLKENRIEMQELPVHHRADDVISHITEYSGHSTTKPAIDSAESTSCTLSDYADMVIKISHQPRRGPRTGDIYAEPRKSTRKQ